MIAYDLVQIVKPGAPISLEPGRYMVQRFDREEMANRWVQVYNARTNIPQWVSFRVERHDESCPARAYLYVDRRLSVPIEQCTCTDRSKLSKES